jgi:RNA polymerase subunit RPABC4/transcription elongation factor Spt4
MKEKNEDINKSDRYELDDYPEVDTVDFPKEIYIAYAVCGKICGNREFIVDGQTQVCEYCNKNMFRTEIRKYVLAEQVQRDVMIQSNGDPVKT